MTASIEKAQVARLHHAHNSIPVCIYQARFAQVLPLSLLAHIPPPPRVTVVKARLSMAAITRPSEEDDIEE